MAVLVTNWSHSPDGRGTCCERQQEPCLARCSSLVGVAHRSPCAAFCSTCCLPARHLAHPAGKQHACIPSAAIFGSSCQHTGYSNKYLSYCRSLSGCCHGGVVLLRLEKFDAIRTRTVLHVRLSAHWKCSISIELRQQAAGASLFASGNRILPASHPALRAVLSGQVRPHRCIGPHACALVQLRGKPAARTLHLLVAVLQCWFAEFPVQLWLWSMAELASSVVFPCVRTATIQ